MIPIVGPGTRLAGAYTAGGLTLVVENNSANGLRLTAGESFQISSNANQPVFLEEAYAGDVGDTYQTNSPPATSSLSIGTALAASFPVGAILLNTAASEVLVENDDYVWDYERGALRFLPSGARVQPSRFYAINGQYRYGQYTHVKLGESLPLLEFSMRLVHKTPKGRTIEYFAPRASVKADNASLAFEATDWNTSELKIEVLQSFDTQYATMPFGEIKVQHDPNTGLEPGNTPDSYTAGVFELFLTPLDATVAALKGYSMSEFSIGNVTVGSIDAPQEYLDHFAGIPQKKDASILLKKEVTINATIDNLTSKNLSLLFDGRIQEGSASTWVEFTTLVQAPANLADPLWISAGRGTVNHAA